MRIKLSIAAMVGVLLAVVGVSLASADSGGSSGDDGARVIKLRAVVDQETFINIPPDATTLGLGATSVFSDVVYDRSSGDRVGVDGGVCTVTNRSPETSPTEATAQCVATLSLSGGRITVQGLVTFPLAEGALPPPVDVAITGDTGDYEGAEGHLTVEELNQTDSNLTFISAVPSLRHTRGPGAIAAMAPGSPARLARTERAPRSWLPGL